jgi:GGDEF domain-containing protein
VYKLRIWLGILIWWLVVFFNIERLNAPINIASFVYILTPVAAGILMLFPWLNRKSRYWLLLMVTIIAYFILKVSFSYEIVGAALPLTVLEIGCLVITILIVRQFAGLITGFEELMSTLSFRQLGIPPQLYESSDAEDLYREVKRSRRFGHSLSVVVVETAKTKNLLKNNQVVKEFDRMLVQRFVQAHIARSLSEVLRDSDLIAQYGSGFAVLLPETGSEDARKIVELACSNIKATLDTDLRIGIAEFPENAITLNGLLEMAAQNMVAHASAKQESASEQTVSI